MSEQPTPITERLSTDRPATENGTHPSVTTSVKLHPARRRIATFDDYAEAERAVERLASHGFPVQRRPRPTVCRADHRAADLRLRRLAGCVVRRAPRRPDRLDIRPAGLGRP